MAGIWALPLSYIMKNYLRCNLAPTLPKMTPSCRFEAREPRMHDLRAHIRKPVEAQLATVGSLESQVAVQAIHRTRRPGDLSTRTKAHRSAVSVLWFVESGRASVHSVRVCGEDMS